MSVNQVILPRKWGRTVDEIFEKVEPCVRYEKPKFDRHGGPITAVTSRQAETSATPATDQIMNFDTEKIDIENAVVNKILNPITYKQVVAATVKEESSLKEAARRFSRIPELELHNFGINRKIVVAQEASVLVNDLFDSAEIAKFAPVELQTEGLVQLAELDATGSLGN